MNDTLELIMQIIGEMEVEHRLPLNVHMTELIRRSGKSRLLVIEDIKQLQKQREIRVWRGLNDDLIQLRYDKRRI